MRGRSGECLVAMWAFFGARGGAVAQGKGRGPAPSACQRPPGLRPPAFPWMERRTDRQPGGCTSCGWGRRPAASRRRRPSQCSCPPPHTSSLPPPLPHRSGMNNQEIEDAVQQCKKDMFAMRIKFAKREVQPRARMRLPLQGCRAAAAAMPCCPRLPCSRSVAAAARAHARLSAALSPLLRCCRSRAAAHTPAPLVPAPPQEWKPSEYKALKRKVAQLLTVRREREVRRGAGATRGR